MSYYDHQKTKLKEVIPVHHGEREGDYWAFHEDGSLAVRGQYHFDAKVDMWREYYPNRRIKREVKYPDDPFDLETSPVIVREWDRNGQLLYDREEFLEQMSGG
jgi:antitoxin component YwqK of YwqJK toxin-antitoxin module